MPLLDSLSAASGTPEDLRAALSRRHEAHEGDFGRDWWALVREAYEHGGAFRAALSSPDTVRGEASYTTGQRAVGRKTYLRRFPREHQDTFARRADSSTYENHVAPVVDVYGGHLTRRAPERASTVKAVEEWWAHADPSGADVQTFVEAGLQRAQLFGWVACLFDRPQGEHTRGEVRTSATWLEPEEVLDWQYGADGALDWIRLGSERCERDPITGASTDVYEYTIWTRAEWARVTFRKTGETLTADTPTGAEHGLGRVPVAVLRWQKSLTPGLFGLSLVNDVVPLVVAHFNRHSELTHHLRSAVFAILCIESDDPDAFKNLLVGTNNGIRYEKGTTTPSMIGPPADVAASLASECDRLIAAIYNAAKLERPRASATGGDVASGVARAYDFAATEAALMGAVANLTTWEYEAAAIVTLWDAAPTTDGARVAAEAVLATTVKYPESFDAAGLSRDLASAFDALDPTRVEQMLPSMRRAARTRLALSLSPDATPDEKAAIAAEALALYTAERAALDAAAKLSLPDDPDPAVSGGTTNDPA